MADYQQFIPFIEEKIKIVGEIILPYFANKKLQVELKKDDSPVTVADRKAEEFLREKILKQFPDHGIIGEEYGIKHKDAEYVWVIDPIDGTKSFISACPLFGTLIALVHNGQPVIGALYLPVFKKLCIGFERKTTINGERVMIREPNNLSTCTMVTSDVRNVYKYREGKGFNKLMNEVKIFRTWGDCYGYYLLVSGWIDIVVDPIMEVWDILALIPIIQGAGGVATAWDGSDAVKADSLVAAHSKLHPKIIEKFGELNRQE